MLKVDLSSLREAKDRALDISVGTAQESIFSSSVKITMKKWDDSNTPPRFSNEIRHSQNLCLGLRAAYFSYDASSSPVRSPTERSVRYSRSAARNVLGRHAKLSPMPLIVILIILLVLFGGGGYYMGPESDTTAVVASV